MRRLRPGRAPDAGETLIEMTLAITLMAAAGVVFAASLATAVKGAALMEGEAGAGTVVTSAAQTVANEAKVPFNTGVSGSTCDWHTAQSAYQSALNAVPPPSGFTTTVTDVEFWEGTAFTSSPATCNTDRLQRVAVRTTAPDGATETVAVAKGRILGAPWITNAQALISAALSDSVTVSGGASAPSGHVGFKLWPLGCTATAASFVLSPSPTLSSGSAATGTVALPTTDTTGKPLAASGANGWETTTPLAAGTYEWRATYLGDANNGPATTGCPTAITSTDHQQFLLPTIGVSSPPSLAAAGATLNYPTTLTWTGSTAPTGNISLSYFTTSDCSGIGVGAPVTTAWTGPNTQSVSVPLTTALGSATTTGNYYLLVSYSGDSNYAPSPLTCGNLLHVDSLSVALTPTAGTAATVISAVATLANPSSPTGTVTFTGFASTNCSGTAATITPTTPTAPNGSAGSFTAPSGTNSILATYPGDANNAAATQCIPVTIT